MTGLQCNQCKRGYFFLSQSNVAGCSQCYCMGHSTECTASSYFVDQVSDLRICGRSLQVPPMYDIDCTVRSRGLIVTPGFNSNP